LKSPVDAIGNSNKAESEEGREPTEEHNVVGATEVQRAVLSLHEK